MISELILVIAFISSQLVCIFESNNFQFRIRRYLLVIFIAIPLLLTGQN